MKFLLCYIEKIFVFCLVGLFIVSCQAKLKKDSGRQGEKNLSSLSYDIKDLPKRAALLKRLSHETFDILVIGGGATGSGVLLDAQSRGLKSALIEAKDFSYATSSRSTKLAHGGVRYLERAIKHLNIKELELVKEALRERQHFLQSAPHLTRILPIITPAYSWWSAIYYWVGLKIYDFISKNASLGESEFISYEETVERFPMIKKDHLKGSVIYHDGQFDDARMNLSIILTAIAQGASALNYVIADDFIKKNEQIVGVLATDSLSGKTFPIKAKIVVNATGPYADRIRRMDDPKISPIIVTSQGSHILLPESYSKPDMGMIIPKTSDGRVLFVLPWQGKTLVGTTDEERPLNERPLVSKDELGFIINNLRQFLDLPVKKEDILATFSGFRPLVKLEDNSKNSQSLIRDSYLEVSASGLITIVGGKWTTYRKMAEEVVDKAVLKGDLPSKSNSRTADLKLWGAKYYKKSLARELISFEHFPEDIAKHLAHSYGDKVDEVININHKMGRSRLVDGYPFIEAEVIYAVRVEYAQEPSDILARRMRLAFLDHSAALKALPKVVSLLSKELSLTKEEEEKKYQEAIDFMDSMRPIFE